jgi:hypothetical protein
VPADALSVSELPSLRFSLLWCAVQLMVSGVTSGEAPEEPGQVINVNSGTALEALVRGGVGQLLPAAADSGGYPSRGTTLRIGAGGLEYRRAVMADYAPVMPVVDIAGELLVWRQETGLDGVVLMRTADGTGWLLHG